MNSDEYEAAIDGHGTGFITTRQRFMLAEAAQADATAWTRATWPDVPEERLKDRAVGFADGFAAAIRLLRDCAIIVEHTERDSE